MNWSRMILFISVTSVACVQNESCTEPNVMPAAVQPFCRAAGRGR